jgi:short-subunit dehydrogenase
MGKRKLALVTGASSGIGRETAKSLVNEGYEVIAAARRLDRLEILAEKVPGIIPRQVDFADPEQTEIFSRELLELNPPAEVLVNNAGYAIRGAIEDVPLLDTRRLFEVNVFSVLRITQACLARMRSVGKGLIVNISSVAGKASFPCNSNYSATKHAIEAFTESLRLEVAHLGIRVVLVRPGPIATEFNEIATQLTGNRIEKSHQNYKPLYAAVEELFKRFFGEWEIPGPKAVAKVIIEAITAEKPLSAYEVGPFAKKYLPLRKQLDEEEWIHFISENLGL